MKHSFLKLLAILAICIYFSGCIKVKPETHIDTDRSGHHKHVSQYELFDAGNLNTPVTVSADSFTEYSYFGVTRINDPRFGYTLIFDEQLLQPALSPDSVEKYEYVEYPTWYIHLWYFPKKDSIYIIETKNLTSVRGDGKLEKTYQTDMYWQN